MNPSLDSKPIWKSGKLYFSSKHSFGDSKIALNENGKILAENIKIAKTFNSFFESVTDFFEIKHKFKVQKIFFQCVSEATVRKVVKSLPSDKANSWRDSRKRTKK